MCDGAATTAPDGHNEINIKDKSYVGVAEEPFGPPGQRMKCYESVSFIGRIRSSWKPRIWKSFWLSIRATLGSTEVLRTIFCSQTSVWRAAEFAKTLLVLRPPNAWESIAL
jgi:hypothetical protein